MNKKQGRPKLSLFFLALGTVVAIGAFFYFSRHPVSSLLRLTSSY